VFTLNADDDDAIEVVLGQRRVKQSHRSHGSKCLRSSATLAAGLVGESTWVANPSRSGVLLRLLTQPPFEKPPGGPKPPCPDRGARLEHAANAFCIFDEMFGGWPPLGGELDGG
jgi:hypothetical protein